MRRVLRRHFRFREVVPSMEAELLIEEYKAMYGARAVVNRCGVIGVHLYGGAKGC
jgi:hypothetical protein